MMNVVCFVALVLVYVAAEPSAAARHLLAARRRPPPETPDFVPGYEFVWWYFDAAFFKIVHAINFSYLPLSPGRSENPPPIVQGHIIPHSHCDPGWLQTFEVRSPIITSLLSACRLRVSVGLGCPQGYFNSDVANIISGVTNELLANKDKRFVWAET